MALMFSGAGDGVPTGPALSIFVVTDQCLSARARELRGRPGSLAAVDDGLGDRAVLDAPLRDELVVFAVRDDEGERLLEGVAQLGVVLGDGDAVRGRVHLLADQLEVLAAAGGLHRV